MKNQILTTAIIILSTFWLQANSGHSEPCEGAFVLNSQVEVDDFAALACTEIGSLTIETTDSNDPIIDLTGLINLGSISFLNIINNSELTTLDGLSGLTYLAGLDITNNRLLFNISALQIVGFEPVIFISYNPQLNNCCVVEQIYPGGDDVFVFDNGPGCSFFNRTQRCDIRGQLFENVDTLGLMANLTNLSPIISCNGSDVFTLFSSNNSLVDCPLPIGVSGFTNGGGVFAAIGSSGWIKNDQISNYNNHQFFNNCLGWFYPPDFFDGLWPFATIISKDIEETPDITDALFGTFIGDLYNNRLNFISSDSLSNINSLGNINIEILIIDDKWNDFTPEKLSEIEDFIERGGSLLLFGSGADYIANIGKNITNYPMNQIGKMLGITWTNASITSDDPVVFTDFYPDAPTCSQSETNVYDLCGSGNSIDFLCENLTTCYSFDGNYLDLSGNENDGVLSTLSVSIPYTIDRDSTDNKALEFTEFPQLIELPKNMLNCVYCTQSFWIKTTAENGTIISAKNEVFKNLYKIRLEDGKLGINLNSNDDAENFLYADKLVNDGDWHHIVIVIDKLVNTGNPFPEGSKEIKIYVDEESPSILPESTIDIGINQLIIPENEIYLGNAHRITDGIVAEEDQFLGSIDDLQFYDKALTPDEIKSIENCKTIGPLESDCNGDCGGDATPGTSCDDGAPNTLDDVYDADCNCIGVVDPCNQSANLDEGVCYIKELNDLKDNHEDTDGNIRNDYASQYYCIAKTTCDEYDENGEDGWASSDFMSYVWQAFESRNDGPLYDTDAPFWIPVFGGNDLNYNCTQFENPLLPRAMEEYLCFGLEGVFDHYLTEMRPVFYSFVKIVLMQI